MFQPYTVNGLASPRCWRRATDEEWAPLIDVSILYRGFESGGLKALVDSGAMATIIEASIGERLGIPIRDGQTDHLTGFTQRDDATVYFHEGQLRVARTSIRTRYPPSSAATASSITSKSHSTHTAGACRSILRGKRSRRWWNCTSLVQWDRPVANVKSCNSNGGKSFACGTGIALEEAP